MSKVSRIAGLLCLAATFVFAPGALLRAQSAVDGAVGGTVQDASGAVVSNALVVVLNNGTNAQQNVTADQSGFFRAIHLQPGDYTVKITASGFADYSAPHVTVSVGSLTSLEPKLAPAGAVSVVEVNTEAPSINTTNNEFSNTIDLKILEDLPVNNYRWSSYALLTPGVVEGGGFGLLSFRGQSTLLNNVTFDGADDNQAFFSEERGRTRVGYSTAKSSIQEFQVNTSNYSVEYGRSAGGVVNAVTRSGTNQFHGEMYFFDRDAEWGASNPFTFHSVQTSFAPNPLAFTPQVFKPKDWRKQTGLGIGGPILKDKLFFFFAFDKFLRNFPGISGVSAPAFFYTVPDAVAPNGTCTGTTTSTVDGAVCALAVNLSKIPGATTAAQLGAVSAAQYTAAYNTYNSGIAGINSITGLTPRTGDQGIFFPKVDWQINGKNHATFEINRLRWTSPAGIQTSTSVLNYGVRSFGDDFVKDTFGIAKLDTSITNTISNEVRYQYGRDFEYEFNQKATSYENSVLLNPTTGPAAGYVNPYQIAPNVSVSNALSSGFGTATFLNRPAYPDERRYQIADTVNLVRGNHNFKFGVDFLHSSELSENLFAQYGGFTYGGSNYAPYVAYFTDLNTNSGCSNSTPGTHTQECYTGYTQGFGPLGFEFQTKDYAVFLQDEWKVMPRLSLTMGVRYEYQQQPNAQIPNLTAESVRPFVNGSTNVLPDNRTNIGPRVGFAWDVYGNGKTSVRGGYGEFFARLENSTIYNALAQTGNSAGQLSVNYSSSAQGGPQAFPQIINPVGFAAPGVSNVIYFDKNFKLPEIHQADLTVEQDLGYKTTLGITWLAAFGRRLPDFKDTNLPAANTTISYTFGANTSQVAGLPPAGTVVKIPYYRALTTATGCQITAPSATCNGRPDSRYGATTDIFSGVNSNYEGLVFQFKHQTTRNLSFSANYTWSHALDYGENNTTFSNTNSLFDPNNLRAEYGNSNQNIPNRLVAYAVYNTPSTFHGILGYLLNNYEIAPSFQAQSGAPYSAGLTGTSNNLVLDDGTKLASTGTNTAASTSAGVNGSGGTSRAPGTDRNIFHYKRDMVLDARLSKRFRIMDKVDIELLGEAFNLANHLNQTGVSSQSAFAFSSGTAVGGVVTSPNQLVYNTPFAAFDPKQFLGSANSNLIYTPRQVQLGARVQF